MPDLFPETNNSFKSRLRKAVEHLAVNGIFIGTSSWKYAGWCGLLYDEQRYCYRGKFAESRFERDCLAEYAETFKTVCVDAAYYQFPSTKYLPPARAGLIYYLPRRWYWHFCLWQGLRGLGFKVVRIIKLNHHHVWDLRLRAKIGDGPDEVRRLGRELQKLCALHGPPETEGQRRARASAVVAGGNDLAVSRVNHPRRSRSSLIRAAARASAGFSIPNLRVPIPNSKTCVARIAPFSRFSQMARTQVAPSTLRHGLSHGREADAD